MVDRAKKISELTAHTAPSSDDLLVIVDSPSSNAVTKKVTVGNFFANVAANVAVQDNYYLSTKNLIVRRKETPDPQTAVPPAGSFFFDDNYLYVVTSNGTIKRASLSTF